MNNLRLLAGALAVSLLGAGACAYGRSDNVYTLEQLFEIAETNSALMRPSFTAREEARRQIAIARNDLLPEIEASLSLSYIGNGFTTRRDFSGFSKAPIPHLGTGLSLKVTQPLYTGGAVSAKIDIAELKSTAATYDMEARRDDIRMQIAADYLDIYECANLRDVVDSNVARARRMLSDMRLRYEQGVALLNDITRYELLVADLELQLVKLDNTMRILNSNLTAAAGLPEGSVVSPDTTILQRSLPGAPEEWWQSEAKDNSAPLSVARSVVDISRRAEDLVRAERRPKVGLSAGWSIDGPILVEVPPINRNLSYWYVGVGVSYNISSLYKSDRSLARSRVATRHAEEEYDAALVDLHTGVRAAYIKYLEAYEELKTQRKSVELAERNYNVVATRYSEGMALITDLLDAASSSLDAARRLVNARVDIIYCYYRLLYITGKI